MGTGYQRVINLPDAGIAREVNGIGGWVDSISRSRVAPTTLDKA